MVYIYIIALRYRYMKKQSFLTKGTRHLITNWRKYCTAGSVVAIPGKISRLGEPKFWLHNENALKAVESNYYLLQVQTTVYIQPNSRRPNS